MNLKERLSLYCQSIKPYLAVNTAGADKLSWQGKIEKLKIEPNDFFPPVGTETMVRRADIIIVFGGVDVSTRSVSLSVCSTRERIIIDEIAGAFRNNNCSPEGTTVLGKALDDVVTEGRVFWPTEHGLLPLGPETMEPVIEGLKSPWFFRKATIVAGGSDSSSFRQLDLLLYY